MRKHRVLVTTFATAFVLGVIGIAQTSAQNGVISFHEACNNRAYVMRGEAESASNPRVLLPLLPPIVYSQVPLDISTSGPVTVLMFGLFAVQVNDIGGNLVPDAPVNIRLAANANLPANINDTGFARFSPTGDRVVLVSDGVLVVADIVRDGSLKVTGLTNPSVVANLSEIGSPSDSNITVNPVMGFPDFSPDGTKIVVSIFGDLWLLTLNSDGHTLASSQPLTRTVRDTEYQAAFSPDGNTLAYISGQNIGHYPGIPGKAGAFSVNLFKLSLGTLAVTQLLSSKDSHRSPIFPAWSPDGQFLAFAGEGERTPRGSSCFNYDIFEIEADGAGNPTLLTNTVGTGFEDFSQWGR